MRFTEIDLVGVYVAPMSLMIVAAWFVTIVLRRLALGQPVNRIVADILRMKDEILVEHWDVIQDEASREQSKSGLPMFGDRFPK
jgi:predicted SnoaL-like aldol condensation-catalyzing enzyme